MKQGIRNKEVRLLIVEDEVHNSRMLEGLLEELRPRWKVEAVLQSIEESVEWLKAHELPDLMLLDIQLSDGLSFSIFEHVHIAASCRIIFTTAYDEYAIRAFKVNSIDYLLKPIERRALELAFQKFEELSLAGTPASGLVALSSDQLAPLFESILERRREYRTRFLVAGISSWQKIESSSIAYIYSENKVTFAVDWQKKEYTLDFSLEQLESELDPGHFFRASRKIIVHADAVRRFQSEEGGRLTLSLEPAPDFEVSVSRLKAGEFKRWMGK